MEDEFIKNKDELLTHFQRFKAKEIPWEEMDAHIAAYQKKTKEMLDKEVKLDDL